GLGVGKPCAEQVGQAPVARSRREEVVDGDVGGARQRIDLRADRRPRPGAALALALLRGLELAAERLHRGGRLARARLDLDLAPGEEPADAAAGGLAATDDHGVLAELGADPGNDLLQGAAAVGVGLLGHAFTTPTVSTLTPGAVSLSAHTESCGIACSTSRRRCLRTRDEQSSTGRQPRAMACSKWFDR